tara:strand:- start:1331 stop:1546 length:216 start_codon:yes stop_codon:yes gene_type:complete
MAKPLVTASLVAPAFLGLNTQESSVANDPRFALEANNCVIDEFGRLVLGKVGLIVLRQVVLALTFWVCTHS